MATRRVVAEARMKFGQFDDIGAGGEVSSYVTPDMPILRENDDIVGSLSPERSDGREEDLLSPIPRPRAAVSPDLQRPPSHHRGYGGPTTPSAPSPSSPPRNDESKKYSGPNAQYVRPGITNADFRTKLSPQNEASFVRWVRKNHIPFDVSNKGNQDYDMRGFYNGMLSGDPDAKQALNQNDKRIHFSDKWKTPYHKSFSAESKWASADAPRWNDKDQLIDKNGRIVFDERSTNIVNPVGPHDFAHDLASRAAVPVPPHAQRVPAGRGRNRIMHRSDAQPSPPPGHGHNAVMRRGAGSLAATAAPKGAAFTRHIYDAARRAGIPETQARLAAAQAAHETDYGRRAPGHNYFGVKGSGTAGAQMLRTHEQGRRGLYATRSRFARYAAPEDSLQHWWAKIQRQWPQAAGSSNVEEAVKGLRAGRRGGYATDARYNEKIRRIAATLARPSTGASPKAIAGGATPQGPVPPTSTAGR